MKALDRAALWLVIAPVVLLAVVLTTFMALMTFGTLTSTQLTLAGQLSFSLFLGLIIWLVVGILRYKHLEAEHP